MTIGVSVVAAVTVFLALTAVLARRAPEDPDRWHVDPVAATVDDRPHWYRLTPAEAPVDRQRKQEGTAPRFDAPVDRLAEAFDEVAMGEERVQRLAGSPSRRWVTYRQRSAVFGFPDYVSVRFLEDGEGGSTLAVYSRARYGYGDGGVNADRVRQWVDETAQRMR